MKIVREGALSESERQLRDIRLNCVVQATIVAWSADEIIETAGKMANFIVNGVALKSISHPPLAGVLQRAKSRAKTLRLDKRAFLGKKPRRAKA